MSKLKNLGSLGSGIGTGVKNFFSSVTNKITGKSADPLDPFGTEVKAKNNEPNLANLSKNSGKSTEGINDTLTQSNKTAGKVSSGGSKSSGGSGSTSTGTKAAKDNDADNQTPLNTAGNTSTLGTAAAKTSSPLKTAGKVAAAGTAGAGLTYLGVTAIGSQTPTPNPYTPNPDGGDTDGDGIIDPTYLYQTGFAAVDEGLNWLQTQIDEVVTFLDSLVNSLFGGGDTSGSGSGMAGGWDFGTYDDGSGTSSSVKNRVPVIIVLVVVTAVIVAVVRKNGKKNGKKGGKKK